MIRASRAGSSTCSFAASAAPISSSRPRSRIFSTSLASCLRTYSSSSERPRSLNASLFSMILPSYLSLAAEPVDQDAVAQPPVAHGERVLAKLRHHRLDHARACQDDRGAVGLKTHDAAPLHRRASAVQLDLTLDLDARQHCALHDLRIVPDETVHDCGDVGD